MLGDSLVWLNVKKLNCPMEKYHEVLRASLLVKYLAVLHSLLALGRNKAFDETNLDETLKKD
jgi:hypothetical protein